ncbi:hypothetical protein HDV04_004407 [Boothiomyces sp. JEL0838]|nr:hypothetical protein HDV04_004407 [Boothiomyces sp. JEL0838]
MSVPEKLQPLADTHLPPPYQVRPEITQEEYESYLEFKRNQQYDSKHGYYKKPFHCPNCHSAWYIKRKAKSDESSSSSSSDNGKLSAVAKGVALLGIIGWVGRIHGSFVTDSPPVVGARCKNCIYKLRESDLKGFVLPE